jgi:hypothetical protein
VSPKRGDPVTAPPGPGEWQIRFHTNDAVKGWEELCRQAPGNTLAAWTTMRRNPAPPMNSPRHHRLSFELATGLVKGRVLNRWQIEVTGGGRVWYLVDPDTTTVWMDYAGPAHPKATD